MDEIVKVKIENTVSYTWGANFWKFHMKCILNAGSEPAVGLG